LKGLCSCGLALQGVKEIDNLAEGGPEVSCRAALGLAGCPPETGTQQVMEIPPHAVHGKQAEVMEMECAGCMGLANLGSVNLAEPVSLADLTRDIVVQSL